MYHIFFIHSSVDGHLRCFHILTIVNCATVNIGVHVSFRIMVFCRYMHRSVIAVSYGISIFSSLPLMWDFDVGKMHGTVHHVVLKSGGLRVYDGVCHSVFSLSHGYRTLCLFRPIITTASAFTSPRVFHHPLFVSTHEHHALVNNLSLNPLQSSFGVAICFVPKFYKIE